MDNLSILEGGFYKWLKEINETESSTDETNKTQEVDRLLPKHLWYLFV